MRPSNADVRLAFAQSRCSPPFGCGVRSTSTTSSSPLPSTAPGPRGTPTSTTARGKQREHRRHRRAWLNRLSVIWSFVFSDENKFYLKFIFPTPSIPLSFFTIPLLSPFVPSILAQHTGPLSTSCDHLAPSLPLPFPSIPLHGLSLRGTPHSLFPTLPSRIQSAIDTNHARSLNMKRLPSSSPPFISFPPPLVPFPLHSPPLAHPVSMREKR